MDNETSLGESDEGRETTLKQGNPEPAMGPSTSQLDEAGRDPSESVVSVREDHYPLPVVSAWSDRYASLNFSQTSDQGTIELPFPASDFSTE